MLSFFWFFFYDEKIYNFRVLNCDVYLRRLLMIRLSKSILSQDEVDAVAKVILEDGYLGMGKEVQFFENELSSYLENTPVACVNSGTAALHLALQALGVGFGDEVLVPSFTFLATYQAISSTGATPVSCDVNPSSGLLELSEIDKLVTKKTKALVYVHYASRCGHLKALYEKTKQYGLRVVEDAAHSFGCRYEGKKIGSFGDVTCFSFDGIKNITSGEGGAIASNDLEVMNKVRDSRLLGIHKDSEKRYLGQRSWDFDVTEKGWRYHMSNIMAAIGRTQLKKLDNNFALKRKEFYKLYSNALANVSGLKLLGDEFDSKQDIVPHIFPIRILNKKRDQLKKIFEENEIQAGIHYKPNHLLTFYSRGEETSLPATEALYEEILSLPLHPELTAKKIEFIIGLIKKSLL